jgi:hypothetical protein
LEAKLNDLVLSQQRWSRKYACSEWRAIAVERALVATKVADWAMSLQNLKIEIREHPSISDVLEPESVRVDPHVVNYHL